VDVAAWPHSLGMEQYELAFRENAIDEHVLRSLTADDLKELGIASIGHRRKRIELVSAMTSAVTIQLTSAVGTPSSA
jgi:hypothetical protein